MQFYIDKKYKSLPKTTDQNLIRWYCTRLAWLNKHEEYINIYNFQFDQAC